MLKQVILYIFLLLMAVGCNNTSRNRRLAPTSFLDSLRRDSTSIDVNNIKEKFKEYSTMDSIFLKTPVDVNNIKEKFKEYFTSTILHRSETSIYYKPDSVGFYGRYHLIDEEQGHFKHAGTLIIFSNESPWHYDNKSDEFVEIYAESPTISVFDSISVGWSKERLIYYLGEPNVIEGKKYIYYDNYRLKAVFYIKNEKIDRLKVGYYKTSATELKGEEKTP